MIFIYANNIYSGEAKYFTEGMLLNFSGGDRRKPTFPQKTIHTSLELAQNCGLGKKVASGAMIEGIVAELMAAIVGATWFNKGKVKIKFILPIGIGDCIIPYAKMIDKDGNSYYEVWAENQNQQKIIVGQAFVC